MSKKALIVYVVKREDYNIDDQTIEAEIVAVKKDHAKTLDEIKQDLEWGPFDLDDEHVVDWSVSGSQLLTWDKAKDDESEYGVTVKTRLGGFVVARYSVEQFDVN